jgi:hypothetical protein
MRSVGLGLAFAATVQFVLVSTPAFAQPPADNAPSTTTPAASTGAAPAAATPAAAAGSGKVTVHVQSSKPVSLEHRASGHQTWEFVCNSPCDQALSSSDEYHIVGVGLNDSRPFVLDTSSGDKVTLDVTPGSRAKYSTGTWVLVGGGVLLVGGVITLLAGSSSNAVPGDDGTTTSTKNTNWIFVGTVAILGSVILGITGGSLMVDNSHTKVDGAIDAKPEKKNDDTLSVKAEVSASRQPTWHDEKGPVLAPVTNIIPIIHTTF